MKLEHHAVASLIMSGLLYATFKSWSLTIASLLSGIFTDLDHLIEYLIEYGMPFNVKKFFHSCYGRKFRRAFLVFHAWEWLLIWFVLALLTEWDPWISGILVGFSQHMILDQVHNRPSFWGYSFLWRWKNGFDYKPAFPERDRKQSCPGPG